MYVCMCICIWMCLCMPYEYMCHYIYVLCMYVFVYISYFLNYTPTPFIYNSALSTRGTRLIGAGHLFTG